jgi:hypothetical protein
MAIAENIPNTPSASDPLDIIADAVSRAAEIWEAPDGAVIGRYPMLWIYASVTGKSWEEIDNDAIDRFRRSRTFAQLQQLLEWSESKPSGDDIERMQRTVYEHFSRFLYCKWIRQKMRNRTWSTFEIALTCPDDAAAFKAAEFQECIDEEIAYLDFNL